MTARTAFPRAQNARLAAGNADAIHEHLHRRAILPTGMMVASPCHAISLFVVASPRWLALAHPELLVDACLLAFAVNELLHERDMPVDEIDLRVAQYIDAAAGEYCPEVAFDPIALGFRSLAVNVRSARVEEGLQSSWTARIRGLLTAMLHDRRASVPERSSDSDRAARFFELFAPFLADAEPSPS